MCLLVFAVIAFVQDLVTGSNYFFVGVVSVDKSVLESYNFSEPLHLEGVYFTDAMFP